MPKVRCRCGASINLSPIPNPNGFYLWSEGRFDDRLIGISSQLVGVTSEDAAWDVLRRNLVPFQAQGAAPWIVQCTACGRLAVLAHPGDNLIRQWYAREKPPDAMLASLETDLVAVSRIVLWRLRRECRLFEVWLVDRAETGLRAYVIFETNADLEASRANGTAQRVVDLVYAELERVGRGKKGETIMAFEFDSDENVTANYQGDYFLRLR